MRILIGGDISIKSDKSKEIFRSKQVDKAFDERLLKLFSGADEVIVNLECVITDKDTPIKKYGPNLNAPFGTGDTLKNAGVTICALANNHIFDFGKAGMKDTFAELKRCGLAYTGYGNDALDARKNYIINREGKSVAIINVCEHEYSYALSNREGAREYDPYDTADDIVDAKTNYDYVVVIYHGGKEDCRYPSPRLVKLCRSMVKHGADVVLCQHSHCIGCYENFMAGHILYGQGNFYFPLQVSKCENQIQWDTGLAVVLDIDRKGLRFSLEPTVMKDNRLCLATAEEKALLLSELATRSKSLENGEWYKHWQEFCCKLENYTRNLKSDNLDFISHYIDCEAHLDVIKERHKTWNHTNEL